MMRLDSLLAGLLGRAPRQRRLAARRACAHRAGAAALFGALAAGCAAPEVPPPPPAVTATVTQRGDTTVLTLSASPTVAALAMPTRDSVPARVERLALPDTVTDAFIQDVAALPDGRYALLMRDLFQVAVLRDGAVERWFGRAGKGPGEFRDPYAIEARADGFAVMDLFGVQVFSPTGQVLEPVRLPWVPDWSLAQFRMPNMGFYTHGHLRLGPEDVTRRLSRAPGGYALIGGPRQAGLAEGSVPWTLLRVPRLGAPADSLGRVAGPVKRLFERVTYREGDERLFDEPFFQARSLVAGTDDWLAVLDAMSGRVTVQGSGQAVPMVINWRTKPVSVTDDMRGQFVRHFYADLGRNVGERAAAYAKAAERMSSEEAAAIGRKGDFVFAEVVGDVAAMFADGDCLWLVGSDPRDFTDGTSHWGLAINVRTRALTGPVRLARRGMRLRAIGYGVAYSTRILHGGGVIMERVALPTCAR